MKPTMSRSGGPVEWSRVRYCFDVEAHTFKECGRWPKVAAPTGVPMPPEAATP